MDYKIYEKEKEIFIKYVPSKKKGFKKYDKKNNLNNPFNIDWNYQTDLSLIYAKGTLIRPFEAI